MLTFEEREFIPVVLGGDINTYSVARAFYEEYHVKTYVFGKFPSGPSYHSKITIYEHNTQIDTDAYFLERIEKFAEEHKDKKIILTVVDVRQAVLLQRFIDEVDPQAFLMVTKSSEVVGKGFMSYI